MDGFLNLKQGRNTDVESNENANASAMPRKVKKKDRSKEGKLQISHWIAICCYKNQKNQKTICHIKSILKIRKWTWSTNK